MKNLALFGIILLLVSIPVFAQADRKSEAWETKAIDKWDEKDVGIILNNSPWTQRLENHVGRNTFIGTIVLPSYAVLTLRSSLIIRLATIRKLQLKEKYDSMEAKKKAEFNKKYKPVLECSLCERFYIVGVAGDSSLLRNAAAVKRRSKSIFLTTTSGEKRELADFSPQTAFGSEALFFFPRYNDKGEALLSPNSGTLTFRFKYENGDDSVIKLLERVEIKVADLVQQNQVIF